VKIAPPDLARLASLTAEMYDGARAARAAYETARALSSELDGTSGEGIAEYKAAVDALAPAAGGAGGRGGRGGAGAGGGPEGAFPAAGQVPVTLQGAGAAMLAAAMAMQGADVAPTARDVAACAAAREQSAAVMARFNALTTTDLAALNARRKVAGQPAVVMPKR
jgi:hypothetical protein